MTDRNIESFSSCVSSLGIHAKATCHLVDNDARLVASESIPSNGEIARVPNACLLSGETAHFPDERLCIMHELLVRPWPYKKHLPHRVETLVDWDDKALDMLHGTGLPESVRGRKKQLRVDYDLFAPLGIPYADFCWADAMFWSRAIDTSSRNGDMGSCIVPLVDMCNHSLTPNAYWDVQDDHIVLISRDAIPSGHEICISYGEKSNAELLFAYGFTLPDNPYDQLIVPMQCVEQFQEDRELCAFASTFKKQLVARVGVDAILRLGKNDLSSDAILVMLVGALDANELPAIQSESKEALWAYLNEHPHLSDLQDRARLMLVAHLQNTYATLSEFSGDSKHAICAQHVVHGIRRVIEAQLDTL